MASQHLPLIPNAPLACPIAATGPADPWAGSCFDLAAPHLLRHERTCPPGKQRQRGPHQQHQQLTMSTKIRL
jgi:hypothetical protein